MVILIATSQIPREKADAFVEAIKANSPKVGAIAGLTKIHFFVDRSTGKAGTVSYWDSAESLKSGGEELQALRQQVHVRRKSRRLYVPARLALGGGVAANEVLRERLGRLGVEFDVPSRELCTDNAAMIASAARYVEQLPFPAYLELDAYASGERAPRA